MYCHCHTIHLPQFFSLIVLKVGLNRGRVFVDCTSNSGRTPFCAYCPIAVCFTTRVPHVNEMVFEVFQLRQL